MILNKTLRINESLASPNSRANGNHLKSSKPERHYVPFTNGALEIIKKKYKDTRLNEKEIEWRKNSISTNTTATHFCSTKLEKPTAKLIKYPDQIIKWDKINNLLAKRCKRNIADSTLMNRTDYFHIK